VANRRWDTAETLLDWATDNLTSQPSA
jgi:hypothetical protein